MAPSSLNNVLFGAKTNISAVVPPSVTDDSNSGYSIGSLWVDTVGNVAYICVDASVGAAVWTSGSSTYNPNATQRLAFGYVASSLTTVYTVPTGKATKFRNISVHNGNASPESVAINLILNGDTAGDKNVFFAKEINGGETATFEIPGLSAGDEIAASTTTSSKVSIIVSGTEVDSADCDFPVLVETALLKNPMEATYSVLSGSDVTITLIAIHSKVDPSEVVVVNLVPNGGSATLANELQNLTLTLKETVLLTDELVLTGGDAIHCSTTTDDNTNALIFAKAN